jgi:hypothetical protein
MKTIHRALQAVTPLVPGFLRSWVRSRVSLVEYDLARQRELNPFLGVRESSIPGSRHRLGIIEDVSYYHKHYMAACQELGISFVVLDLLADDWVARFRESRCDAFLVWPSSSSSAWKEAFDYRLRILEHDLGQVIYPSWPECWLTEHKPRLRDWLDAHGIVHPRTWVSYSRAEALELAETLALPIVSKTATGASGNGVWILRDREALRRTVREAFGRGQCPVGHDPRDRQRGFVFLQEYLPNVYEWRMVRIGDSYFGYRKEKGPSGVHSASHLWSWLDPGEKLLDLLKHVTDTGGFTSMNVDVFLTEDGRMRVNECQTTFGCTTPAEQMKINGVEGRYLHEGGTWRFEPGEFCQNHMCNLRIKHLLSRLDVRKP